MTMTDGVRELVVGGTLTLDTTERAGEVHADVPGGSALYAATAASVALPARIVGTVGTDFAFDALRDVWSRGVDPSAIEILEGRTFRWHARYDADGDDRVTLARDRGVADGRTPPVPAHRDSNYALLLGSTNPRIQQGLRDASPDARVVGLDSMSHWWSERPTELLALLERIDVLFVDEGEMALAVGTTDPAEGADRLLALGPALVVVKSGSRGAWIRRRGQAPLQADAVALARVADPTGAGDAFAGAFITSLGRWPERGDAHALRFASAVASFAVEGIGTSVLARATPNDVRRRMATLYVGTA